ncbi:hypothetical protein NUW54_g2088 [Trametes sanguinea]|uniref:Uncharacterized protein n=1 Tax=Trametes sanguinea TaxID=158606 RepID=A0ACC1Q8C2_9APHY|nr:hypothetical protein NUW54_g2088 [Trametes sanguinea]
MQSLESSASTLSQQSSNLPKRLPVPTASTMRKAALQEGTTSLISRSRRFDAEKVSRTMEAEYTVDVLGHGTSFLNLTRIDLS